ncbi:MAG: DUF2797 domain-containing protein, partial [Candidatus Shikimatogenerans sp. JK-2022]|nr:DUF2797 domain-containing protein [Candidatus Shikimatogenerans bostrichidophilus]
GNIKIGITTQKNFLIRLMNQGAIKAIKIAITPNRYLSGLIENICKKKISDKTHYIKMLTNTFNKNLNLKKIKKNILKYIYKKNKKLKIYFKKKNKIYNFIYPIIKYPNKIKLFSLNKKNYKLKNKLIGIKGQYLIFKNKTVFNINKHLGYSINLKII